MRARVLAAVNNTPLMLGAYGLLVIVAGSVVAALEDWPYRDGLWWAVATTTTVGYGDLSPATGPGRVVGAVTMWLGIVAIGITVGRIAAVVIRTRDDWTHEEQEASRDREERMLTALASHGALLRDSMATTMPRKPVRKPPIVPWLSASQRGLGWRLVTESVPPVATRVLVRQRLGDPDAKAAAGVVTQNHGVPTSSSTVLLDGTNEVVQLDSSDWAWREHHVHQPQERTD